nr:hypothetical protein [Mycoplasmopsis agassizii]
MLDGKVVFWFSTFLVSLIVSNHALTKSAALAGCSTTGGVFSSWTLKPLNSITLPAFASVLTTPPSVLKNLSVASDKVTFTDNLPSLSFAPLSTNDKERVKPSGAVGANPTSEFKISWVTALGNVCVTSWSVNALVSGSDE